MPAADAEGAPWYLRLGAWIGIGTGPGALVSGGGSAALAGEPWLWPALVIGATLLTALSVANAVRGQQLRAATVELASIALGERRGPWLVGALIATGTTLWTGFYIGIAAGAFAYLLDVDPVLTAGPLAAALWLLYVAGFARWNLTVVLTGVASLAVGMLVLSGVPDAPGTPLEPSGWSSTFVVMGVVVAYAAVFAVRASDFTWDAQRTKDVLCGGLILWLTLTAFLVLGAAIFLKAGSWELADLVNRTGAPAAGALLLVLSAIAPSVSGIHSAALALERLDVAPPRWGAGISAGLGGLLGAWRFDLQLVPFLQLLGAVVPALLPVLLMRQVGHRNIDGWLAWISGAGAALLALAFDVPAHILLSLCVSGVMMLATSRGWRASELGINSRPT